ncbi:MAG TPA: hypothetical protein VMW54_03290 [Terriglobia bacterium]|nr:hypothetical protein [Terriglobia bacterium]
MEGKRSRLALSMFARKIHVEILRPGQVRECPVGWLDNFCMRSFTGRTAFDDALPVADGLLEVGFRVDLKALQEDLEDWLTRKHGRGARVKLRLTETRPG